MAGDKRAYVLELLNTLNSNVPGFRDRNVFQGRILLHANVNLEGYMRIHVGATNFSVGMQTDGATFRAVYEEDHPIDNDFELLLYFFL